MREKFAYACARTVLYLGQCPDDKVRLNSQIGYNGQVFSLTPTDSQTNRQTNEDKQTDKLMHRN